MKFYLISKVDWKVVSMSIISINDKYSILTKYVQLMQYQSNRM